MGDLISALTTIDKRNRRTITDRLKFSYTEYIPERRSGRERRKKSNCCNENVSGYETDRGYETIKHPAASGRGI